MRASSSIIAWNARRVRFDRQSFCSTTTRRYASSPLSRGAAAAGRGADAAGGVAAPLSISRGEKMRRAGGAAPDGRGAAKCAACRYSSH